MAGFAALARLDARLHQAAQLGFGAHAAAEGFHGVVVEAGLVEEARGFLAAERASLLLQRNQHTEAAVPAPAIVLEVAVEGEDVAGVELVGHVDEAGIGEVARRVAHTLYMRLKLSDSAQSPS